MKNMILIIMLLTVGVVARQTGSQVCALQERVTVLQESVITNSTSVITLQKAVKLLQDIELMRRGIEND